MKTTILVLAFVIQFCSTTTKEVRQVNFNGEKASIEYDPEYNKVRIGFTTYIEVEVGNSDKEVARIIADRESIDLNQRWGELIMNLRRHEDLDKYYREAEIVTD